MRVIAPHDLRRTFAKLAYRGGSPIDQIQLSLGHDSIQTTEEYLGVENGCILLIKTFTFSQMNNSLSINLLLYILDFISTEKAEIPLLLIRKVPSI
jgi:hypothetical protein